MKANINPGYERNRVKLKEHLPLNTPFRITIAPTHFCNFKCFYCTHSSSEDDMKKIDFKKVNLTYDQFKKIAYQISEFPNKVKLIAFSGIGEPLINKELPKMIKLLRDLDVAEKIEIFTNGLLLNKELSDQLIEAGVDRIKVSLQGLDEKGYRDVCKANIDFEDFMKNLKYFYNNRKNTKVYIKIIDDLINKEQEEYFYETFGDICDEIFIEHLFSCQTLKGDCDGKVDGTLTVYQEEAIKTEVCQLLFYSLMCDAEGFIYPCASLGLPKNFAIGNVFEDTIVDIWNNERLCNLRIKHLEKKISSVPVCNECGNYYAMYHPEDNLDTDSDKLLDIFKNNLEK